MAGDSVWIDLDEVDAAAKLIMDLLEELEGPANQLEAKIKQVQASVYGTDLLGKSLQGGGSSVGGLAQHQEQVLAGIRTLMQNATAMGQNLKTMADSHRSNDEARATEIGRITDTGAMPADPNLAGLRIGTVESVPATPLTRPDAPLGPVVTGDDPPVPPPAPVVTIGTTNPGGGYHDPDAPDLDYNHGNPLIERLDHGGAGPRMV
ncbi:WXG100 family type VII secretion target [Kitasatospora sp. NPDC088134]|uniref:WXG100 family type VII secretion target n=1 Tax=Kitasatospora sp. NPDC088134 TaxID=3364071 RepID=UPI0038008B02